MTTQNEMSLGHVAYRQYVTSLCKDPSQRWSDHGIWYELPPDVQAAWESAAQAIRYICVGGELPK